MNDFGNLRSGDRRLNAENTIARLLRGGRCAVAVARWPLRGGGTELIGNELSHAEFHANYGVALTLQEKSFSFRIYFWPKLFQPLIRAHKHRGDNAKAQRGQDVKKFLFFPFAALRLGVLALNSGFPLRPDFSQREKFHLILAADFSRSPGKFCQFAPIFHHGDRRRGQDSGRVNQDFGWLGRESNRFPHEVNWRI